MSENNITYDSLLKDVDFLESAYRSLRALGVDDVNIEPKDILDSFLTNKRYFDINLGSAISRYNSIQDFSEANKSHYANALSTVEKLPNIFEVGGAPKAKAFTDYAIAGAFDPTNLVAILAGLFSFGTLSGPVLAGKELVKQGVSKVLLSRIKNAVSKNALKAYAVQGTTSGAGGLTHGVYQQNAEKDIGLRNELDWTQIGLQGLAEGVASPIIGSTLGVTAGTTKDLTKMALTSEIIDKALKQTTKGLTKDKQGLTRQDIKYGANRVLANIAPLSSLDETSYRLVEKTIGEEKPIREAIENLSVRMEDIYNKNIKGKPNEVELRNLINTAMEKGKISKGGREIAALPELKKVNKEMYKAVREFQDYGLQAYEMISGSVKRPWALQQLLNKYKLPAKGNYVREIYGRYFTNFREPIEDFLTRPENRTILDDLGDAVEADKKGLGVDAKLYTKTGKKTHAWEQDEFDSKIKDYLEKLYKIPNKTHYSRYGALKKKKELPEVIKQIYGVNFNPGLRALETVKGIIDSSTNIRLLSKLASSLINRGEAVKARSIGDAVKETGVEMVPLVTTRKTGVSVNERSPFALPEGQASKKLLNIYVPKTQVPILKMMGDTVDRKFQKPFRTGNISHEWIDDLAAIFSATQGYMKKKLTVYSPRAHIRNASGAGLYVTASGNVRGLLEYGKFLKEHPPGTEGYKKVIDKLSGLGLTGSQVDINQILTRIGSLNKIGSEKKRIELATAFLTGGLSAAERHTRAGKWVAKKAENIYTKTDDIGKIATFFNERNRAQSVFDAADDVIKDSMRNKFGFDMGLTIPKAKAALKKFDEDILDEMAIRKTMDIVPVYSRIPKILEKMRMIPILGSFTAFPAENLRNKFKIVKLAGNEIRDGMETGNKTLVRSGMNRLVSQYAIAHAPYVAAYTYNEMAGTDKVAEFARSSLPEWQRNHALLFRKDKDDPSKYYMTDLSYTNPDQFVMDIAMPFIHRVTQGEDVTKVAGELFKESFISMGQPFLQKSLVTQAAADTWNYINSDTDEQRAALLAQLWKYVESGVVKDMREMAFDHGVPQYVDKLLKPLGVGPVGSDVERQLNKLYFGEDRKKFEDSESLVSWLSSYGYGGTIKGETTEQKILTGLATPWIFGSKEQEFSPKKVFAFEVRNILGQANKDYTDTIKSIKNKLEDKNVNIDMREIAEEYEDVLQQKFEGYRQILETIKDLRGVVSDKELMKMLKDKQIRGRLSQHAIMTMKNTNLFTLGQSGLSKDSLFRERQVSPYVSNGYLVQLFRAIERGFEAHNLNISYKPINWEAKDTGD